MKYILKWIGMAITFPYWLPSWSLSFSFVRYLWPLFFTLIFLYFIIREFRAFNDKGIRSWTLGILTSKIWIGPVALSSLFFLYIFLYKFAFRQLGMTRDYVSFYPASYIYAAPGFVLAGVIFYWHLFIFLGSNNKVKALAYWFLHHHFVTLLLAVHYLSIFGE